MSDFIKCINCLNYAVQTLRWICLNFYKIEIEIIVENGTASGVGGGGGVTTGYP